MAHMSRHLPDAHTELVVLLGYPVRHSASPRFQTAAMRAVGINAEYIACEVTPYNFTNAFNGLRALGARGANFTVPHKQAAYAACDLNSREARVIEAVNTVRFRDGKAYGYNTDAYGIAAALKDENVSFNTAYVVLLGAGGAARAIAAQALLDGAAELHVVNRTVEKAEEMLTTLLRNCRALPPEERPMPLPRCHAHGYDELRGITSDADLLINATSVGLKENDPRLLDTAFLNPRTLVYDTIYAPPQTRLLIEAKQHGCFKTVNGLSMLLHQGARAFEIWFDRSAPLELMRHELQQPRYASLREVSTDPSLKEE